MRDIEQNKRDSKYFAVAWQQRGSKFSVFTMCPVDGQYTPEFLSFADYSDRFWHSIKTSLAFSDNIVVVSFLRDKLLSSCNGSTVFTHEMDPLCNK